MQCQRRGLRGAGGSIFKVAHSCVWQDGAGCCVGAQAGLSARALPYSPPGLLCRVSWASSQRGGWTSRQNVLRDRKWKLKIC